MANTSTTTISWDGGSSPMNASYGKLMMWFFLLSDAFTFSALLITYGLVRSAHPAFDGLINEFTFSQTYWPVPEKVFEAVPFLHGWELPLVFVGAVVLYTLDGIPLSSPNAYGFLRFAM